MKRFQCAPRLDWESTVEEQGLIYHQTPHPDGTVRPYWTEDGYWSFTLSEVNELERVTNELHQMCLTAAQHVIDEKRYAEFGIPSAYVPSIEMTWEIEPPSLYGRFDFAYDGVKPAKMLEYNADTPTSLLEAAVVQWYWQQDQFPDADQWNSLHERLVAVWSDLKGYLPGHGLHLAYTEADASGEDLMTVSYIAETARQAGIDTRQISMEQIGWDRDYKRFCGLEREPITSIFKLYPWEWMADEEFGEQALRTMGTTQSGPVCWIEPIWKMLLSNKAILAILWELYPGHPNLLPAYFDGPRSLTSYVRKPKLSREGANVTLHVEGQNEVVTGGDYGEEGYVYQAYSKLPTADGYTTVLGSWIIGQESGGMGIRESESAITNNLSRFVPHIIEE